LRRLPRSNPDCLRLFNWCDYAVAPILIIIWIWELNCDAELQDGYWRDRGIAEKVQSGTQLRPQGDEGFVSVAVAEAEESFWSDNLKNREEFEFLQVERIQVHRLHYQS
jgi:hypothetical protein